MRRWTKMVLSLGCTVAAFAALTVSQIDEAEACVGPPPSDCGVNVNCPLAAPQMGVSDDTASPIASFNSPLWLNRVIGTSHPICDAVLGDPSTEYEAHYDLDAQCGDIADPESLELHGSLAESFDVHNQGINRIGLEMELEPGPARKCNIGGDVTVEITPGDQIMQNWFTNWFGQPSLEITTGCSEVPVCVADESPISPDEPAIDVRLLNTGGVITSIGGKAEILEYEVVNNTDQAFAGTFDIASRNTDAPLEVPEPQGDLSDIVDEQCTDDLDPNEELDCEEEDIERVCGCDLETYANSCELEKAGVQQFSDGECLEPGSGIGGYSAAMEGDGDNFPIAFRDQVQDVTECITLPDNPSAYTSPTLSRQINIPAGQSQVIEIVQRSWGECDDGSCSQTSVDVTGVVGTDPVLSCASGALIINEQGPDPDKPEDEGDFITVDCEDTGTPTEPDPFPEDGEDEWYVPPREDSNDSGIDDYIEDGHPDLPDETANPEDYSRDVLMEQDTTDNGIPDYIEIIYGVYPLEEGDPVPEALQDYPDSLLAVDSSGNGVSDYEEIFIYASDPFSPHDPVFFYPYITIDTNGNGVPDFIEVAFGYDPLDDSSPANPADYSWDALLEQDSSGNGVPDIVEILFGYDPLVDDVDNPADYSEAALQARDSDGDGLSDYEEIYIEQTHPLDPDTDNDGVPDGAEVTAGSDPLDPNDPAGAANSATPDAGITFKGSTDALSTLVYGPGSEFSNVHTQVQRATAVTLSAQKGRIYETINIDQSSVGDTIDVVIPFDVSTLENEFDVNRLELGEKFSDDGYDGTYLSGKGMIRLDSSPFTIFDFLYQGSVWATNDATGASERLALEEGDFVVGEHTFEVVLSVEAPNYDIRELRIFHDLSANERIAIQQDCTSEEDTTGNGLSGCDDPYCEDDPVCDPEQEEDTGTSEPDAGPSENQEPGPGEDAGPDLGDDVGTGGNQDQGGPSDPQDGDPEIESGCGGCAATSTGQPVGFAVMLLLGMALMVRNRRRGVEEGSVRIR